jgi:hypothetical protein
MRFEAGVLLTAGLSLSSPVLLAGECAAARGANPTCDINIDRETPSSPLPIRLNRNAAAHYRRETTTPSPLRRHSSYGSGFHPCR